MSNARWYLVCFVCFVVGHVRGMAIQGDRIVPRCARCEKEL